MFKYHQSRRVVFKFHAAILVFGGVKAGSTDGANCSGLGLGVWAWGQKTGGDQEGKITSLQDNIGS